MKNILIPILLILICSSCCSNKDVITYNLTNEEKALVPYEINNIIKWQDNTDAIFESTVLTKTSQLREISDYDCKLFEGEIIEIRFTIDNSPFYLTLNKWEDSRIDLSISSIKNKQITFYIPINNITNSFGTINFNEFTFENSIIIDGHVPNNTLIYSKTHGIEFILFEDGTWYKRVE